jgi:hypothetical protein
MSTLKKLNKVVNKFVKSQSASPAQKSSEWYILKSKTIGGSEVATVLGINPFKSLKSLIADKANISTYKFNGNLATRWGNMFESITRDWTELILNMENSIVETGSLPGAIEGQRYSPDGLGVVYLKDEDNVMNYYIALFEFKSPFKSIPSGEIPKHYIPQIQTGLWSIPICELAIFVNNSYRKCSIEDFGFSTMYDFDFHKISKKNTKLEQIKEIYACGIICFYQVKNDENNISEDNMLNYDPSINYNDISLNEIINTSDSFIDFGNSFYDEFYINKLFELVECKHISVKYYPMTINYKITNEIDYVIDHDKIINVSDSLLINPSDVISNNLNDFKEYCNVNELKPIGVLPWKLVKTDIINEIKDENWLQVIELPIKNTLKIINEITNHEDPQKMYNELYPVKPVKSNIVINFNELELTNIQDLDQDLNIVE